MVKKIFKDWHTKSAKRGTAPSVCRCMETYHYANIPHIPLS